MRIHPAVLVCLALSWIGPPAGGDEGQFYVTAKLAKASVERQLELGPLDTFAEDEDGWSAGVGYSFGPHLALQAEYLDLGAVTQTRLCGPPDTLCLSLPPLETDSSALSTTVVGRLPLGPRAAAFGKAGLARLETRASSLGTVESKSDDLEAHFGAGLRLNVWRRLSLLAEYEAVGREVDSVSFGASVEF